MSPSRSVSGSVRSLIRLEGLALAVLAVGLYARSGAGWGQFAALFLVPDLSLLGYLLGPRVGAASYNTLHSTLGPILLGAVALLVSVPGLLPIAFIWAAHVGVDRALGFGLKYQSAFGHTHLGEVALPGRATAPHAA
jgi:hypothetical protein